MNRRWVLFLLLLLGGFVVIYVFEIQLMLRKQGSPLIGPGDVTARRTIQFQIYAFQNTVNFAVLSVETKLPWRLWLWRVTLHSLITKPFLVAKSYKIFPCQNCVVSSGLLFACMRSSVDNTISRIF